MIGIAILGGLLLYFLLRRKPPVPNGNGDPNGNGGFPPDNGDQLGTTTLKGTVTAWSWNQSEHHLLAGATITVNIGSYVKGETTSDSNGEYVLPGIPPGLGSVLCVAPPLSYRRYTNITFVADQTRTLNINMFPMFPD